jgi:5-methylcytosine-specific restriction endonuclease McrA
VTTPRRWRFLQPCLVCGTPVRGAYCPEHDDRNARRRQRQEEHGRNTPEWIALSRTRRALAGRCEVQLDDRCTGQPDTAHLNPDRHGEHRGATLDDVRAACRHCHGVADAPRATPRTP